MRKAFLALAALTFFVAACGPGTTPEVTHPPDPTATSLPPEGEAPQPTEPPVEPAPPTDTPEPEPAVPPDPIDVEIEGAAGLMLKGTFYGALPNAAPGVLMLHMYGRTRADWDALARRLQALGIASLAIDLRGHGETGGAENWLLAPQDVEAALQWLGAREDVDADRLGAIGASIGANLALFLGSTNPRIDVLALLSPGFDYFRVNIEGAMLLYNPRPALLAASEEDGYSAETVRGLADQATGPVELLIYNNAGHGNEMLVAEPGLSDAIIDFLVEHLGE
ncbi:MAG TPA: alpha/beta fold hydrolase [Anaerolineae bacterium]|nr:alpha/beta fold hydrolase [Anaerolineae bacterium]